LSQDIGFEVEKEFAAAKKVVRRLENDLPTRLGAALLTAGVIAWSGLIWTSIIWSVCVLLNELIELRIIHRLFDKASSKRSALIVYSVHLFFGGAIWAGAGVVLWMTSDPAMMTLGVVVLLGTLGHVILIYAVSRLLMAVISSPLVIAIGSITLLALFGDQFGLRDKAVVLLSVVILLGYLATLLSSNIQTQSELESLVDEISAQARQDELTKISNRRHFLESLENLKASDQTFAIAYIDLDGFKPLNDQHGHAIGDDALKAVARRLLNNSKTTYAARLGGDEFGVIFSPAPSDGEIADALKDLWTELTHPLETSMGLVDLAASIGCARSDQGFCDTSKLLHAADVAMLRAKSHKLGVTLFDPLIDNDRLEFSEIEKAFRRAVRTQELRAALQPIKCVRSQSVRKFELLTRWQRADGGKTIPPGEFIALAERLGLLNEVLWSTLEQALPTIRGTANTLAINISPSQLSSVQFFAKLEAMLARHIVPNTQIELEITEQVALRNEAENLAQLRRAAASGFSIVLDDFGTGYASISLLDQLPLSKVKLDHTFVKSSIATEHGQKLLGSIVSLLKQMNLRVCIEGVEDSDIELFVSTLQCEEVQGFHIGRPSLVTKQEKAFSDFEHHGPRAFAI